MFIETFPSLTSQNVAGNFSESPKSFQTLRDFPNYLDFFQIVRNLSILTGNFPDSLEILKLFLKFYALLEE